MDVLKSRVRDRITRLEHELKNLSKERRLRRERRNRSEIATISLVGYTNAGKSTLLNTLTKAGVLTENRMFATLDPTSRQLRLPGGRHVILTDTVGFIRDLPDDLSKAFRATLEELNESDLLLHLLDSSNPQLEDQKQSVDRILDELALDNIPILVVLNKWDQLSQEQQEERRREWTGLGISALDPSTLEPMLRELEQMLESRQHATPGPLAH
jgi:GTP-binding protein HflX